MLGLAMGQSEFTIAKDTDLLASRLERLFFTSIGESIGHLDKGSRILEYFWEGDTEENAQGILREVKFILRAYEPNVIPTNMMVTFQPVNSGGGIALIIDLSFYWIDNENQEYDIRIIKIKD